MLLSLNRIALSENGNEVGTVHINPVCAMESGNRGDEGMRWVRQDCGGGWGWRGWGRNSIRRASISVAVYLFCGLSCSLIRGDETPLSQETSFTKATSCPTSVIGNKFIVYGGYNQSCPGRWHQRSVLNPIQVSNSPTYPYLIEVHLSTHWCTPPRCAWKAV